METTDKSSRRPEMLCRRCGRELTNPDSYAAMIGPICAVNIGICQRELARLNMSMDPNLVAAAMDDGPSIISLNQPGNRIVLKFKYDLPVINQVRQIQGRQWDGPNRCWTVPAMKANIEKCLEILPQARIYVKDLARIKAILDGITIVPTPATSQASTAPQAPIAKKVELIKDRLCITFGYDPQVVEMIKQIPGRKWAAERRRWEAPISMEGIAILRGLGFQFDKELIKVAGSLTPKNKLLFFSLCPLYNIIQNYGGWENAKGCIREKAEQTTGRSNQEKPTEREGTRSQEEGNGEKPYQCTGPTMEGEGVTSYEGSNATPRGAGKTPEGTGKGQEGSRDQLQRREWSGTYSDNQISEEYFDTAWLHPGILNSDQKEIAQLPECSRCLQNRLCQSGNNGSNRSGWTQSQYEREESARPQENRDPEKPWLVCPTFEALSDNPPAIKGLYPFQKEGVNFVESRRGRVLLGHEMGLGKTVMALSWLRLNPKIRPAIIVVPASLKINWEREGTKWSLPEETISIINGRSNGTGLEKSSIYIINYDILNDWLEKLQAIQPKAVIVDEAHYIKSPKAARTQAVMHLVRGTALVNNRYQKVAEPVKHIIAMSGTPIVNRPAEFYNTINLIRPELFPSWYAFTNRYCQVKAGWGGHRDISGSANEKELHEKLVSTIMLRRLKSEVLTELSPKVRTVLPMEIINRREYARAEADFLSWLAEKEGSAAAEKAAQAEALVFINKMKQLTAYGKLDAINSWIQDVLDQGEKLIVFAVHHAMVDAIMAKFGDIAVKLTGKESQEQRQEAVDGFQNNDNIRLFVGNIKAAGVGITLTAATYVAFTELGWTPGEHDQAEDRAHRIGQLGSVNVYYLIAANTIEEEIATLIDKKRQVLTQVLDGKETKRGEMLKELLNGMRRRMK
jgi:superfamily II DNA or RNA helicase